MMYRYEKNIISKSERGIATIESIISLTIFIFVFAMLYSIINMCIVQAKVQTALNASAKEISQYTYFYYKFNLDKTSHNLKEESQSAVAVFDVFQSTISNGSVLAESVGNVSKDVNERNINNAINDIKNMKNSVDNLQNSIQNIAANPSEYVKSFAALATSELLDETKNYLASMLADKMSERHFTTINLEKMGVVGGYNGMNFEKSKILDGSNDEELKLVVFYELRTAEWMPFDISITISQSARTRGWAGNND